MDEESLQDPTSFPFRLGVQTGFSQRCFCTSEGERCVLNRCIPGQAGRDSTDREVGNWISEASHFIPQNNGLSSLLH